LNATELIADLKHRGVSLVPSGMNLIVDAPPGSLTVDLREAIAAQKFDVLRALQTASAAPPAFDRVPSPLAAYAADKLPPIRLTLRETHDLVRDFKILDAIRKAIAAYEPGGNRVQLRIVTVDGRKVTVEWQALAERGLRHDLALVLAREGRRKLAAGKSHDERMVTG
jgi:hypothetical protein